jgi:hypothetical protein
MHIFSFLETKTKTHIHTHTHTNSGEIVVVMVVAVVVIWLRIQYKTFLVHIFHDCVRVCVCVSVSNCLSE